MKTSLKFLKIKFPVLKIVMYQNITFIMFTCPYPCCVSCQNIKTKILSIFFLDNVEIKKYFLIKLGVV